MKHINLLPKTKQSELAHESAFYSVAVAVGICTAILLVGVLVQLAVGFYINRAAVSIEAQIEQLKKMANKSENAEVKKQIMETNAQITDFSSLAKSTPEWSEVLEAFVSDVPAGIKVTQFDGELKTGEINIRGYSPTRDQVIDLYNNINADKTHFKDINYPLENVTQPTDVRFNFQFTVADGILTPKP